MYRRLAGAVWQCIPPNVFLRMMCTSPRTTFQSFTLAVSSVDFQLSLESEGVGSAYPDQPLAATADETVGTVLQLLRAQRTGAVVICEGSKLVGIFTERDALKQMASGADLSAPVRTVMSSPPAAIASAPRWATRSA